jgi:hypothetical protein
MENKRMRKMYRVWKMTRPDDDFTGFEEKEKKTKNS